MENISQFIKYFFLSIKGLASCLSVCLFVAPHISIIKYACEIRETVKYLFLRLHTVPGVSAKAAVLFY